MISLRNKIISASTAVALLFVTSGLPLAMAAPKAKNSINVVPRITSLQVVNGALTASGEATAVINGVTATAQFFNVPVTIAAQPAQAGTCPVLDLMLGPIHLNLLGLDVLTSEICLVITADSNAGLLGQLLCSLGNLLNLNPTLTAGQILTPGQTLVGTALTPAQITQLLGGLTNLLNQALLNLLRAILVEILPGQGGACSILHLELGPLDLTLLGLNVVLDNCDNGPITVDITAIPAGGLLGDLLCRLLGGGTPIAGTLQSILNRILVLLNAL